jgi:hypothetical protein
MQLRTTSQLPCQAWTVALFSVVICVSSRFRSSAMFLYLGSALRFSLIIACLSAVGGPRTTCSVCLAVYPHSRICPHRRRSCKNITYDRYHHSGLIRFSLVHTIVISSFFSVVLVRLAACINFISLTADTKCLHWLYGNCQLCIRSL